MNRTDNITKHHTGIELSLDAIDAFLERGVSPKKINLWFAFYIKWYKTDPSGGCDENPVGCKTTLMENPLTGADLGQSGAFPWHDRVPAEVSASYKRAMAHGKYDSENGGHYLWDVEEDIFWSWDTPNVIAKKFPAIMEKKKLGGTSAWGLGEDADDFEHLMALTAAMKNFVKVDRGETMITKTVPLSSSQMEDELEVRLTVEWLLYGCCLVISIEAN